jgi:aminoglycoside phosphotransferase family enzyme/predicted kinase
MTEDDQTQAVEFLSRGASFGLPNETPKRIDTHISIVFLIGDRVFKMKRAMKLSFLDYSMLAERERLCRAEYDLNRRTAPALYRGVRRLTRAADGGVEWDGQGALIEPVLEMTRFDDDALFDRLATDGKLTPAMMVQLGDIIAEFHAGAEVAPHFGGSAGIDSVIADDTANLRTGCPPLDRAAVDALHRVETSALAKQAALLDGRQRQGKVRRCHGDLHLRNICLFEDKPTLFDCIEFSDEIACIDTLFDFAFLLMDLEHRGLRGLANIVFNRYLDRSGEIEGLTALPLFLSVRASIRAKVAVAALKVQKDAAEQAKAYLDLAINLLEPAKPRLIAIAGLSGSGKSTIAAGLAGDFAPAPGARHLRSDVLRKTMMKVAPETKLPPSAYTEEVSAAVYRTMREQAAAALAAGYSAIVDATFIDAGERAATAAIAARAGVAFTGLWLTAPEAVLLDRIAKRRGDASDADRAVLEQQLKADLGAMDWRKVDVSGDPATALAAARAAMKAAITS